MQLFSSVEEFSSISGLSAYEIRNLCRRQLIPSEWTGKRYRIDTEGAIAALKNRAVTFEGHKYDFTAIPRKVYGHYRESGNRLKMQDAFLSGLDDLKKTFKHQQ